MSGYDRGQAITEYVLVIAMVSLILIFLAASHGDGSIYQGFRNLAAAVAEKLGLLGF